MYGDWSAESGYDVGRKLLQRRELPDAVFAANDQMALGLVRSLTEAGRTVPDDLSIVGFDDVDGSAYFNPPLTTIRQDFALLGERCIDLLLAAITDRNTPDPFPVKPVLVVRGSTAAQKTRTRRPRSPPALRARQIPGSD